jgi:tRNA-dependent cyclodipeptide synthase
MQKYIAKINLITPWHLSVTNLNSSNAYFAISLSNPNFFGKRLGALLKLLDENFNKVMILTSGYLYRYHYMTMNNCNESAAAQVSVLEEEKYISQELGNYTHFLSKENFLLTTWIEHYSTAEFKSSLDKTRYFYKNNLLFKKELYTAAITFLEYKWIRMTAECGGENFINEQNIQNCIDFFLEEIAMFDYLGQNGFNIQVYPGVMQVLNDISNGKFPDAPQALQRRVNVEVKLSKIGNKSMLQKNMW